METYSPKSRYATFLAQFDFGVDVGRQHDVRWFGNVGYIELGENSCAVARIELTDRGYQGTFDKFDVQIVHRISGKLDSITFNFSDYLTKADRCDDRVKDQPDQAFYAWTNGKNAIDWYIAKPRSVAAFEKAVNAYLQMWAK